MLLHFINFCSNTFLIFVATFYNNLLLQKVK
nr:MAG TPA: hypothetical protein [Bacteriophage sp.]